MKNPNPKIQIPDKSQIPNSKFERLKEIMQKMKKVLVAYSGGADSTFLLKVAVSVLGRGNVLAVTAKSPTYPASELRGAKENAKKIGARHLVIATRELDNPNFSSNPADRCYYCKSELFKELKQIAKKEFKIYPLPKGERERVRGRRMVSFVIDASNIDDLKDYRPGSKSKKELGVRSPLQEAGFSKADVRQFSKKIGLSTWDKPAMACLASRLPYDERIEVDKLKRIEAAEEYLHKLGFRQVRVRCHGDIARIEVPQGQIKLLNKDIFRGKIIKKLKSSGFLYVTVDLEGYRTGSLNERVKLAILGKCGKI